MLGSATQLCSVRMPPSIGIRDSTYEMEITKAESNLNDLVTEFQHQDTLAEEQGVFDEGYIALSLLLFVISADCGFAVCLLLLRLCCRCL